MSTSTETTSTGEEVTVTHVTSGDDLGKVSTSKTGTGGTVTSTNAKRGATRAEFVWHRELRIDTIFGSGDGKGQTDKTAAPLATASGSGSGSAGTGSSGGDSKSEAVIAIAPDPSSEAKVVKKKAYKPTAFINETAGSGGSGGSGSSGGDAFTLMVPWKYNRFDAKWIHFKEKTGVKYTHKTDRLTLLTWNVLFDLYDADKIHTAERVRIHRPSTNCY